MNGDTTKQYYSACNHDTSQDESAELLQNQEPNAVTKNNMSTQESPISMSGMDQVKMTQLDPLIEKKDSLVKYCASDNDFHVEAVEMQRQENMDEEEDDRDEDLSSESYPASSHYTENTDSVTGGFGLANRVCVIDMIGIMK